jgi:hypothetical protein
MTKLAEVLIDEDQWCKGSMENLQGQCCLMGAVAKANGDNSRYYTSVYRRLADIISRLFPDKEYYHDGCGTREGAVIAGFNDDADITFEDVKKVIECYDVHYDTILESEGDE